MRPTASPRCAIAIGAVLCSLAPAAAQVTTGARGMTGAQGPPDTQAPKQAARTQKAATKQAALFAKTFDAHWQRLRDKYPYFELYGVDWQAERDAHRPRAVTAANPTEFAWELARLIAALPDPHVSFRPAMSTVKGRWSIPKMKAERVERRLIVTEWPAGNRPVPPKAFAGAKFAYPEIVKICGLAPSSSTDVLVAGPLGTSFDVRLRWPDATETTHKVRRAKHSNVPPPRLHFGKRWVVSGRVGSIGYLRIKTFNPKRATRGPDGKMTTMLRAALRELAHTKALILDLQANSGGLTAASDPFLGHLVERRLSYRWGNSGGRSRVIRPRTPRYRGRVVAIVDERSASGGEWAARILKDAGRATVIGGRTVGAEAAVHTSKGPDGSVLRFSAWPMTEPGVAPFQEKGIELDHPLPLTLADVRKHGYDAALAQIRRARFAKALEVLGAPAKRLDQLLALADSADAEHTQKKVRDASKR